MHIDTDEIAYLLEKELAHRWRITQATLQRWRYLEIGPDFVKLFGRILYPVIAVEKFESQHLQSMGKPFDGGIS